MRRLWAYLRGVAERATAPLRCPVCGEPEPTREDFLLHLALEHPVWAEAWRGRLNPVTLWRWIETGGDYPDRYGGLTFHAPGPDGTIESRTIDGRPVTGQEPTREERRAWLHRVARSLYGSRYPAP